MNVRQEALNKLLCANCNLPLSIGPVTISASNNFVCGRCDTEGASINTIYEVLAAEFVFPCRYKSFGCQNMLKWGQAKDHEDHCSKKPYNCPKDECHWSGPVSTMAAHFTEGHKEDVVQGDAVEIQFGQDQVFMRMFDIKQGNYLFSLNLKKKENLKLRILQLIDLQDFTEHLYKFELQSPETKKHLTLGPFHMEPYGLFGNHVAVTNAEVDIGVLKYLRNAHSSLFCKIIIEKEAAKCDQEGVKKVLECPICKECMGIPIQLCLTGHSFCDKCVKSLPYRQCPLCKSMFSNARNYALEDLVNKFCSSCKNKDRGCNHMGWPEDVAEHEKNCHFGNIKQNRMQIRFGSRLSNRYGSRKSLLE